MNYTVVKWEYSAHEPAGLDLVEHQCAYCQIHTMKLRRRMAMCLLCPSCCSREHAAGHFRPAEQEPGAEIVIHDGVAHRVVNGPRPEPVVREPVW